MKTKTITFEEYFTYANNEDSYATNFERAWSNGSEFKKMQLKKKKIIKSSFTVGLFISTFVVASSFNLIAFADTAGLQKLKDTALLMKLQYIVDFYNDAIGILDLQKDTSLFVDILKRSLSDMEIYQFVKAAKGLKFDEIIKLIPTL